MRETENMIVFAGHNRTYTVPGALTAAAGADRVTGWDLLALTRQPGVAEWANKVVDSIIADGALTARAALDCDDCEDVGFYAIEDPQRPDTLITLLRKSSSDTGYDELTASGWIGYPLAENTPVRLIPREIAGELAAVIASGGDGLVLRYVDPIAWLPPTNETELVSLTAAVDMAGTDPNWKTYAIVDELDVGAVLNLVRLAKGPKLEAYTASGGWEDDRDILADMRGVNPPMLVELDEEKLQSVIEQINANAPEEDEPTTAAGRTAAASAPGLLKDGTAPKCEYCANTSSGYVLHAEGMAYIPFCAEHKDKAVDAAETSTPGGVRDPDNINRVAEYPVTAASVMSPLPGVSPDPRAEKLRRYWSIGGKGGLKIRWGTKGDWRRCVRYLSKYMGFRARGYCQNMHKRNTGVWTGSKLNAAATWPKMSTEEALMAALIAGNWTGSTGRVTEMKDGIYTEVLDVEAELLDAVVAGGFPISPPDEWFTDPGLAGPTPLTIEASGRVFGHIATFDVAHIGMPGKVHAPKSRSGYAFFKTGEVVTASGEKVAVGNLTLAGGHAPLSADAGGAVAHYDNTASAIADINVGEDRYGIWAAGALRPEATAEQIRALRASAPSGDWRPINGHLELVAICQVNVPGFPVTRARVASGAVMALVAAGAKPLAEQRMSMLANEALAQRMTHMEAALIAAGMMTEADDAAPVDMDLDSGGGVSAENVPPADEAPVTELKTASKMEDTPDDDPDHADRIAKLRAEIAANKRRESLRMRVRKPEVVAAAGGGDAAPKASDALN